MLMTICVDVTVLKFQWRYKIDILFYMGSSIDLVGEQIGWYLLVLVGVNI